VAELLGVHEGKGTSLRAACSHSDLCGLCGLALACLATFPGKPAWLPLKASHLAGWHAQSWRGRSYRSASHRSHFV